MPEAVVLLRIGQLTWGESCVWDSAISSSGAAQASVPKCADTYLPQKSPTRQLRQVCVPTHKNWYHTALVVGTLSSAAGESGSRDVLRGERYACR